MLTIFLGWQLIEGSVYVLSQIPGFANLKCGIINGALSSPYIPAHLKLREPGIRYRTGCAE
jgi:hypothetical protein